MTSVEHHLANPGISIEAHIGQCCQELSADLAGRRPIYLDLRFWVIAREVRTGIRDDPRERKLVYHLERLARQGRIFCPISATTFVELMKIGDDARRKATLDVIDELSLGVSLLPEPERIEDELEALVRSSLTPNAIVLPRVWTRLAYTMGNFYGSDDRFPQATQLVIQKAFFDHLWQQPLTTVAANLDRADFDMTREMGALARKLNEGNSVHQAEMTSFESVLSDELRGVAEVAEPILGQIIARQGNFPTDAERSEDNSRMAINLLHALLRGEHRSKLPTIHVHASLSALFRWDYRSKSMTGNDLFDFSHAAAALGYCDAFFTEAGITRSVVHQRLKLDQFYDCAVTSKVDAALDILRSLD